MHPGLPRNIREDIASGVMCLALRTRDRRRRPPARRDAEHGGGQEREREGERGGCLSLDLAVCSSSFSLSCAWFSTHTANRSGDVRDYWVTGQGVPGPIYIGGGRR
jgi:hypothetical protein